MLTHPLDSSCSSASDRGRTGLVLHAGGGRVDLVVSAIRDDNPGSGLHVIDRGTTVEVRSMRALQVTATTLAWHVGRGFDTSTLQSMIVSTSGRVTATADRITVAPDVTEASPG